MQRLNKAAEKLRTDPDLNELESELVIFVQYWGLDAYEPPANVVENVRNMVAAFVADASELNEGTPETPEEFRARSNRDFEEEADSGELEPTVELYREAAKSRDRLRNDCSVLLANLDVLQAATGEALDPDDAAIVDQIRADLAESA